MSAPPPSGCSRFRSTTWASGWSAKYATAAAEWERLRLRERQDSVLADDERFLTLSARLQRLSKDLGLQTCTATREASTRVAGITDWCGYLPNDPAYLWSGTWREATEKWCRE